MSWSPAVVLLALLAGGCDTLRGLAGHVTVGPKSPPVVYATDGGSAMLTIIACPRTVEGAAMLQQVLEMMVAQASAIVSSDSNAQARMVLNFCPFAEAFTAPSSRRTR